MRALILAATALMFATSSQPARAEFALAFDDPTTNGIDIIVEDNSSWDLVSAAGIIDYCNEQGSFVTCTTATSKPEKGSGSMPAMTVNVNFLRYAGPIKVMVSDTGFTTGAATGFADATGFIEGGDSVVVTSSAIFLYYYGHDATGKRLWLISDTNADPISFGQSIEFTMFQGSGTFADPSPDLGEWGTLIVIFDSCTSGRLHMDGRDGSKTVAIQKLTGIGDLDCDG